MIDRFIGLADMTDSNISLWEGVYTSFEEAGGDLDAFDTEIWINKQKDKILRQLQELNGNNIISDCALSRDYPLSLIIALLLSQQDHLSMLDFGGGMGGSYLELLAKVPNAYEKISWGILENETTITNIPNELKKYTNLKFYKELKDIKTKFDIVHIGSALHYVDSWKCLLENIISTLEPKYFIFSDLLAGEIPPFVSHQHFYSKRIPIHFFNIKNFINLMSNMNFELIYKSLYYPLKDLSYYPNHALPKNLRLSSAVNLVFVSKINE